MEAQLWPLEVGLPPGPKQTTLHHFCYVPLARREPRGWTPLERGRGMQAS